MVDSVWSVGVGHSGIWCNLPWQCLRSGGKAICLWMCSFRAFAPVAMGPLHGQVNALVLPAALIWKIFIGLGEDFNRRQERAWDHGMNILGSCDNRPYHEMWHKSSSETSCKLELFKTYVWEIYEHTNFFARWWRYLWCRSPFAISFFFLSFPVSSDWLANLSKKVCLRAINGG